MRHEGELTEVEAVLRRLAPASDCDEGTLDHEIALLRDRGWLRACLPAACGGEGWGCEPAGTPPAFEALRTLGRANLSVARLFEGHMNAVKLVVLYGSEAQLRELAEEPDLLLGVWGAEDGGNPLRCGEAAGRLTLSGAKRFASGLGLVRRAVVTYATDAGLQMALAPTDDPERYDYAAWTMSGMRATQSGRYEFDDVELRAEDRLGEAGDFLREPHFEGGIWRYCAAHLGAAEELYATMRDQLVARERARDTDQQRRIVAGATAIETARLWLLRAAEAVEGAGAKPRAAALSLLARQVTEDACRTVIENTERALGMAAHVRGSAAERMARDLRLFLCQAAPDAKRARASAILIDEGVRAEQL